VAGPFLRLGAFSPDNDGMPLLEIDAYRAAKMLIDQHGAVAAAIAIKVIQDARHRQAGGMANGLTRH
jgi:hypothetical protein